MERLVRRLQVLTAALALTACAMGRKGPRDVADHPRAIDSLFVAYSGASRPGASVVVIRDGQVVVRRAYGMADLERRVTATAETDYRLASVSKQFTAMCIMLLARDRKLQIDQPVRSILPELPVAAAPVTIRHLLNHTSGLVDYEDLIPETRTAQLDDNDVLTMLASKDSVYFPAGTSYRYSNSGYVLLGMIVARVSGTTYPQFLKTRIFGPLGMTASVAHVEGSDTVPRRAYGYSPRGGGFEQTDQSVTSATLGDGGIYTSVDDLARWDRALSDTSLVGAELMALATTPPKLPGDAATEYGFGWFIDNYRGEKRWRHTGETSGFHNAIMRFPARRLTVIVLTNRSSGEPDAIAERIADYYLFK
jgi:CubicO group peptidase (beta-lactamase class C family)